MVNSCNLLSAVPHTPKDESKYREKENHCLRIMVRWLFSCFSSWHDGLVGSKPSVTGIGVKGKTIPGKKCLGKLVRARKKGPAFIIECLGKTVLSGHPTDNRPWDTYSFYTGTRFKIWINAIVVDDDGVERGLFKVRSVIGHFPQSAPTIRASSSERLGRVIEFLPSFAGSCTR
jgi:hypothetical protein